MDNRQAMNEYKRLYRNSRANDTRKFIKHYETNGYYATLGISVSDNKKVITATIYKHNAKTNSFEVVTDNKVFKDLFKVKAERYASTQFINPLNIIW